MTQDDEFDISDTYAAQDEALAKIWNDPELEVYDIILESPSQPLFDSPDGPDCGDCISGG